MHTNTLQYAVMLCAAAACATSCVNDDYDLSKDIDQSMTVGGDMTLPLGQTEDHPLSVFLKPIETMSIDTVGADYFGFGLVEGDYYFHAESSLEHYNSFKMNEVKFNLLQNTEANTSTTDLKFVLPTDGKKIEIGSAVEDMAVPAKIESDEVTSEVIGLDWFEADMPLTIKMTYKKKAASQFTPTSIYLRKGVTRLTFDKSVFELEDNEFYSIQDGHIAVLKEDLYVYSKEIPDAITSVKIKRINVPDGCYTFNKGADHGHLLINRDIDVTGTAIMVYDPSDKLNPIPAGVQQVDITLKANIITVNHIDITHASGTFNPQQGELKAADYRMGSYPTVVKDARSRFEIENPVLMFGIENDPAYPMHLTLKDVVVTSIYDAAQNEGVEGIHDYSLRISKDVEFINNDASHYNEITLTEYDYDVSKLPNQEKVIFEADLPKLVNDNLRLPNKMSVDIGQPIITGVIKPGEEYRVDYRFINPLTFGPATYIEYADTLCNWNDKINNIKDISNVGVHVGTVACNRIPLNLKITGVKVLDTDKKVMTDVTVEYDTDNLCIMAGIDSDPSLNNLEFIIKTHDEGAFSRMDGIVITFSGAADKKHVGTTFNNLRHKVRFQDLKVGIRGGLSIDLNDF